MVFFSTPSVCTFLVVLLTLPSHGVIYYFYLRNIAFTLVHYRTMMVRRLSMYTILCYTTGLLSSGVLRFVEAKRGPLSVSSFQRIRGGSDSNNNGWSFSAQSPIQPNPNYEPPAKRSLQLQDVDDQGNILVPKDYYIETTVNLFDQRASSRRDGSLVSQFQHMYKLAGPAIMNSAITCVIIFLLWQFPSNHTMLRQYFVCTKYNVRLSPRILSVALSALSHSGAIHLFFNLVALFTMGPTVRKSIARPSRALVRPLLTPPSSWPMWPLMLGSAITGSLFFLLIDGGKYHGGCMGLSGVTLSILAVYARMNPNDMLGILVAGIIPIRLRASNLLYLLLGWSALGSISPVLMSSRVAHTTHLGGLVFGLAYHEAWKRRDRPPFR